MISSVVFVFRPQHFQEAQNMSWNTRSHPISRVAVTPPLLFSLLLSPASKIFSHTFYLIYLVIAAVMTREGKGQVE
jgi:hypothetical protein